LYFTTEIPEVISATEVCYLHHSHVQYKTVVFKRIVMIKSSLLVSTIKSAVTLNLLANWNSATW